MTILTTHPTLHTFVKRGPYEVRHLLIAGGVRRESHAEKLHGMSESVKFTISRRDVTFGKGRQVMQNACP